MARVQEESSALDRFIDWFIPPELAAQREKRQLARMFLISHLCGPLLGNVVPGAVWFLEGRPTFPMAILAASITAFWVFPFLLKWFGRYNLLCFVSVQNLMFCILWSCYFYGGVTSPTLPWVLTIPLLTFFYIGPSPKLRIMALCQFACNFSIFFLLYRLIPAPPPPISSEVVGLQVLGIVSTLACAGYVTMMALYYRRILDSGAELEAEMRGHLATAAELRRATAEAGRAGAAKAEFVASMSHELRTPLNAVIGYSQMLLEDAEDEQDDQSVADLQKIHKAGKHLLRLVNEVLDLSKIEAGKMELVREETPVAEFLASVVEEQRAEAEAKGIGLRFQPSGDLGNAKWDADRVRQALSGMLDNAVKFTDQGHVILSAERTPGKAPTLVIRITDTGVGIDPQMLPHLFEKFTVAHDTTASKYGDTGLGLALSLALCKLMGGDISVQSTVGEGSCFTVTLPAAPAGARRKARETAPAAPARKRAAA
ncbi:MAG: HAMP domain-containing histidine kinase [Alphaproteobacteria bacterium]|nr:HAMP domain-containing histidine kinase [Alphaproteobacteria bacterium]